MRLMMLLLISSLMTTSIGCILVDTPDVRVGVIGSPASNSVASAEPSPPYASALHKVVHQQSKVLKELNDRKWDDLLDESNDWLEYVRQLTGYAGSTYDPNTFKYYCRRLTDEIQALRKAAVTHDVEGSARAIRACDPILDEFCHRFPLTGTPPPSQELQANAKPRVERIP